MLKPKIKNTLINCGRGRNFRHLLAAVSGGADSIAMLYILHEIAPENGFELTVAHFNHHLRGKAGDDDARFVEAMACRLNLPCVVAGGNVRRRAVNKKISLEMAGRDMRYEFLCRTARRLECDVIATAHTADDQAETMLLKMARGSGLRGLSGISRVAERGGVTIIRPVRDVWRRELLSYLRKNQHEWREDISNDDTTFLRNRVRHLILPLIERQLNPKLRQALWRLGDIIEQEDAWLDSLTLPIYRQCLSSDHPATLNCALLHAWPLAAQRRVLRLWLADAGLAPDSLDYKAAQRVESLLGQGRSGRVIQLPGGYAVHREYSFLRLSAKHSSKTDAFGAGFQYRLKIPGVTMPSDGSWRIESTLEVRPEVVSGTPDCVMVSAAKWRRGMIIARNWRPGDRMRPYGMNGTRKIQDIFGDLKVPAGLRRLLPVLECRSEIIWTPGTRIAQSWAVRPSDRRILRLRFQPLFGS